MAWWLDHEPEVEVSVDQLVDQQWNSFDREAAKALAHDYQLYLEARRGLLMAIAWLIFSFFVLRFFFVALGWWGAIPLAALVVSWVYTVRYFYDRYLKIKQFHRAVDKIMYKKAFAILGLSATHAEAEDGYSGKINELLDHSELITEPRNTMTVDDVVISKTGHNTPLFFAELDARHETGSGKNRRVKKIFHGLFVSATLPKTLTAKTFVSTEGDRLGFGHKSFWKSLFVSGTPRETIFEWNDFEEKLHVATTDETEARYVLTPDFMATLYDWWKVRRGNIRVAFLADRMYILFPDRHMKLGSSVSSLDPYELKQYMKTIVGPLWHVGELLKLVEQRFR